MQKTNMSSHISIIKLSEKIDSIIQKEIKKAKVAYDDSNMSDEDMIKLKLSNAKVEGMSLIFKEIVDWQKTLD